MMTDAYLDTPIRREINNVTIARPTSNRLIEDQRYLSWRTPRKYKEFLPVTWGKRKRKIWTHEERHQPLNGVVRFEGIKGGMEDLNRPRSLSRYIRKKHKGPLGMLVTK